MSEASGAIPRARSEDDTLAVVGYVLLLAGFVTSGVTSLVAVILAYVKRDSTDALAASHFNSQIKTFWIGFLGTLIGFVVMLAGAGGGGYAAYLANGPQGGTGGFPAEAVAAIVAASVGGLLLIGTQVWVLVRCIIGLIRLSSDQATGR